MTNNTILESPAGVRKRDADEDNDRQEEEMALMAVHEVVNDDDESRLWRIIHYDVFTIVNAITTERGWDSWLLYDFATSDFETCPKFQNWANFINKSTTES